MSSIEGRPLLVEVDDQRSLTLFLTNCEPVRVATERWLSAIKRTSGATPLLARLPRLII